MADINDIINHPNFGRTVARSSRFRSMLGRLDEQGSLANLLSTFQFNDAGNLVDRFGTVYTRNPDETYGKYLGRAAVSVRSGFSLVRNYDPNTFMRQMPFEARGTYFSGGQTNFPLLEAAKAHGLSARVASFKVTKDERAFVERFLGTDAARQLRGVVVPDQEQINILQMFDSNNQAVSMDRVFEALGVNPTNQPAVFKRLKAFLSDREVSRVADPSVKIKTLLFDPAQFFGADPQLRRAAATAARMGDVSSVEKAFATMSDGMNIITESGMKRNVEYMSQKLGEMNDELERLTASGGVTRHGAVYQQQRKAITALDAEIKRLTKGIRTGKIEGGFNSRVFGAVSFNDIGDFRAGQVIDFTKGDAIYMSKQKVMETLKRMGYSDDVLHSMADNIDFISSMSDVKPEIEAVGNGFLTMFHQPSRDMAYSNSLTMATFGDHIDPFLANGDRYLMHSLKTDIESQMKAIREGQITPGLMKIVEEAENVQPPVDASAAEIVRIQTGKQYARRLKDFIRNGGDLKSDPFMAQQAMDVIRKHHFQTLTNPDGSVKKIMFQGREQDLFRLRAPMGFSSRAHMANATVMGRAVPSGMASYDEGTGRFLYNGADILAARTAQGGSDLDDALYSTMKYDPKTKRVLYHSLRDPNAMGEYMFYDADITTDPNIPGDIRRMAQTRNQLLMEIRNSANIAGRSEKIAKVDNLTREIDSYFMNETAIPKIDLAATYTDDAYRKVFAPRGYQVTRGSQRRYSRLSPLRGMVTSSELGGEDEFLRALSRDARLQTRGKDINPFSLFNWRGAGHTDFLRQGIFKQDDIISKALLETADERAAIKLTSDDILKRMADESVGFGNLGKFINQFSLIERFVQDYTNVDNFAGVDPEAAKRFQQRALKAIKAAGLTTIERETVIDAMVKTGNPDIVNQIPKIMASNAQQFGQLIRTVQRAARIEGVDIGVGIDPYLFAARGGGMRAMMEHGYGTVGKGMILSEDDPMAYLSSVYRQVSDLRDSVRGDRAVQMNLEASQNLLNRLQGFTASPLETTRAQQFLNEYERFSGELDVRMADHGSILKNVFEGLERGAEMDDILAPYTRDAVQANMWMHAQNWGLFGDTDNFDRQMVAIAQLIAQNAVDTGKFGDMAALMTGSGVEDIPSFAKAYQAALFRITGGEEEVLGGIRRIDASQYMTFNRILKDYVAISDGSYQLVSQGVIDHVDQSRVIQEVINKAQQMRQMAFQDATQVGTTARDRQKIQRVIAGIDRMQAELDDIVPRDAVIPQGFDLSDAGLGRYVARETADATSESVSAGRIMSDTFNAMKRLDRQAVTEYMGRKGFRRGLLGAGIFAGIGLLYGVRGDRSFEDMQGPPLLPGGSAYEDYRGNPPSIQDAIAPANYGSGSGTLYKVNMNGTFNTNSVRNRLQDITGSPVDMKVFNSRQTTSARQSSSELMNEMIG